MDKGSLSYQKFLSGDDYGMLELVSEYRNGLIIFIDSFIHDINISEELAEDTFVKLITRKPYDAFKASFKTWLYTIGKNIAIDYLRKNKNVIKLPLEDYKEVLESDEDSLKALLKEEEKLMVHKALSNIKEEYRVLLTLIYFNNMSIKEAAIILKKSSHAVEMMLSRARLCLKEELLKEGYTYENI